MLEPRFPLTGTLLIPVMVYAKDYTTRTGVIAQTKNTGHEIAINLHGNVTESTSLLNTHLSL
jgi:hypothetical protein